MPYNSTQYKYNAPVAYLCGTRISGSRVWTAEPVWTRAHKAPANQEMDSSYLKNVVSI